MAYFLSFRAHSSLSHIADHLWIVIQIAIPGIQQFTVAPVLKK
jgi:hypothetical protein